jgi:chromosome segregation ATPase
MPTEDEEKPTATPPEEGHNSALNDESGKTPPQPAQKPPETKFTQADVDRLVAQRLQEEQERQQREAEKLKREQEQQEAIRRGEHEQVIARLEAEKATFEAQLADTESRLGLLQKIVDAQLDAQLSELPEQVRKLAPKRDDLDAFQSWLVEARQLAAHLQPKEAAKGNPKTPPAAGTTRGENEAAIKTSLLRSGRYSG